MFGDFKNTPTTPKNFLERKIPRFKPIFYLPTIYTPVTWDFTAFYPISNNNASAEKIQQKHCEIAEM